MGVDPASPYSAWLQVANETNLALTYPLLLNPNGGNVGIGITTPGYKLQVVGSSNTEIARVGDGTRSFGISTYTPNSGGVTFRNAGTGLISLTAANAVLIGTGYAGLGTGVSANTVAIEGNVGIGTTTPGDKLEIVPVPGGVVGGLKIRSGDITAGSTLGLRFFYNTDVVLGGLYQGAGTGAYTMTLKNEQNHPLIIQSGNGSSNDYIAFNTSGANERMRISTAGNVGIGTTSPTLGRLQVANITDSTNTYFSGLKNDGGSAELVIINDDRGFAGINSGRSLVVRTRNDGLNDTGAIASFETVGGSTIYALRAAINGNIGMGTPTPVYGLDVARSGASGTAQFYDQTAILGSTRAVFRAGIAQSGNVLEVWNNAGATVASISATGAATVNNLRFDGALTSGATTVVDSSRNGTFTNLAMSGNFTGTHAQNVGTADTVTFAGVNIDADFRLDSTVTNVLNIRDSGSVSRLSLNGSGAGGFGWYVGAPSLYAQATNSASWALKAIGYPTGTANIFIAESSGGTNYLTVSSAGDLSGTHIQNIGTGDNVSFNHVSTTDTSYGVSSVSNNNTNPTITGANNGNGSGIRGTSTGGWGVIGDGGGLGVKGGGTATGVNGTASGVGGYGVEAVSGSGTAARGVSASSASGYGIYASGGLRAGYFAGAVDVTGALTVGSCTGCGVTSVTGTSPIASSGGATPAISCSTCITTAGGQSITGTTTVGTLTASSSITIGTNNGTTATAGAGFVVSKTGVAYSILGYDNTGACGFGVAYSGAACTSDGTLKNNVQTIGSVISQIMALRPVTYNWNSTGASGMGLIAQEVQAAIPDFTEFLVTLNPDSGKLALSMTNIVPLLIRAVQEMQVEIDVLKGKLP